MERLYQIIQENIYKSSIKELLSNTLSGYQKVRGKYTVAFKTLKWSHRDPWLAQCNENGPNLADQVVIEVVKEALFVASIDVLSVHV
jgi:hypothetical protein